MKLRKELTNLLGNTLLSDTNNTTTAILHDFGGSPNVFNYHLDGTRILWLSILLGLHLISKFLVPRSGAVSECCPISDWKIGGRGTKSVCRSGTRSLASRRTRNMISGGTRCLTSGRTRSLTGRTRSVSLVMSVLWLNHGDYRRWVCRGMSLKYCSKMYVLKRRVSGRSLYKAVR